MVKHVEKRLKTRFGGGIQSRWAEAGINLECSFIVRLVERGLVLQERLKSHSYEVMKLHTVTQRLVILTCAISQALL